MMAAPDPVGCWGAAELMRREYGLPITAITGPATDNEVGPGYIRAELRLPAHNARRDAAGLLVAVRRLAATGRRGAAAARVQRGGALATSGRLARSRSSAARGTPAASCCASCSSIPMSAECVATSRSQAGKPVAEAHPTLAPLTDARFSGATPARSRAGGTWYSCPSSTANRRRIAGEMFDAGPGLVVDLAADFRVAGPRL